MMQGHIQLFFDMLPGFLCRQTESVKREDLKRSAVRLLKLIRSNSVLQSR